MKCKHCGAEFPDWLDFCPECMKSVDEPAAAEAEAPAQPQPVAEPQPAPAPTPAPAPAPEAEAAPEPEVYQSPARPKKTRKKGGGGWLGFLLGLLCAVVAVAALLLTGVLQRGAAVGGTDAKEVVSEQDSKTPEGVLEDYAAALKDGDLSRMLASYAAPVYLSKLPTEAFYETNFDGGETYRIWGVSLGELQASDSALAKAVAAEKTRSALIDLIMNQFSYPLLSANSHFTYDEDNALYLVELENDEDMQDYLAQLLKAAPFSSLEIGKAFLVTDKLSEEGVAAYEENMQNLADALGAEDAAFCYIELKVDGTDYLLGMELVKFDGLWYDNKPCLYGVNLKEDYLNNSYGGLVPVAAIEDWV